VPHRCAMCKRTTVLRTVVPHSLREFGLWCCAPELTPFHGVRASPGVPGCAGATPFASLQELRGPARAAGR
ncbi:hypothetical protein, partial [Streptomyces sp. NPDC056701]|uniref:hypothetical protein n=1 Tax=Streptomyces sp. NPDC056701 TaxID=3345916 RepID=UPI0036BC39F2